MAWGLYPKAPHPPTPKRKISMTPEPRCSAGKRLAVGGAVPAARRIFGYIAAGMEPNDSDDPYRDVIRKLRELAQNLWWSWQPEIRFLFRELDPELWRTAYHNPVAILNRLAEGEVARRVQDLEMQALIDQAHRRLRTYLHEGGRWGRTFGGPLLARPVAYFSAEFGIHQSLPIYSGGLGVLAGDHLKSMSDLGVPVTGVGLLYNQGYVHQHLDENGWQQDRYEPIEAADLDRK